MKPFFSVIIPTYNRKKFLKKALDSVLEQTFGDYELIIVDDGSTDDTGSLIKSLNDKRVKYVWQENKGPSGARNRGIKESVAEWICFLDSDDWWDKRKLEITYDCIKDNPDYRIFHTEEIWYRGGKLLNQKKVHKKYGGWIFEKCLPLCRVSVSTACINRSVFEEAGLFDEYLPCCEDYDFWLRVSIKYPLYLIPRVLTLKEGGHKDQVSRKYWGMDRFRIAALSKILKSGKLSDSQYRLCLEELQEKCRIVKEGCLKRGKSKEAADLERLLLDVKKYSLPLVKD